jgi:hypothetical protein
MASVLHESPLSFDLENIFFCPPFGPWPDLYYQSEEHKQFYSLCKDIPFYRWEYLLNNHEAQHNELAKKMSGRCCFNHLIGLPEKHGVKHNLYLYEYNIFAELMKDKPRPTNDMINRQQYKHIAVIKATGLGITEFVLRWIAWMCVRNDDFKGKRVCIVTGPNIALAITLIKRLKELFLNPALILNIINLSLIQKKLLSL